MKEVINNISDLVLAFVAVTVCCKALWGYRLECKAEAKLATLNGRRPVSDDEKELFDEAEDLKVNAKLFYASNSLTRPTVLFLILGATGIKVISTGWDIFLKITS